MDLYRGPADVDQVAVGKLDALGHPGRARRVDDRAQVVGTESGEAGANLAELRRARFNPGWNVPLDQRNLLHGPADLELCR